ncbi:DUF6708 domain-containing protein [Dyella japonica]|uniref:DUF6708 domain-containing protein n=1 Tax=Dyella japonica TaxID=231455 RepID=A0ABV2K1P7_9GAMM
MMVAPKLHPPCKGWQRDLAGPNESVEEGPELLWAAPNYVDEVYMELSRRRLVPSRSMLFLFGCGACIAVILALSTLAEVVSDVARTGFREESALIFPFLALALTAGVSVALLCLRTALTLPPDQPIRFNRARRKVYVYQVQMTQNPYERWPTTTRSYNWDDLRAEAWKQRGATLNGAAVFSEGVSLAVVRSGTNEVIERFRLAGSVQTAIWAYICTYMQKGPQTLKPSDYAPMDANDISNDPILRWAPKIEWPDGMDAESRSAP